VPGVKIYLWQDSAEKTSKWLFIKAREYAA
jgi:hypothetical protein